MDGGFDFDEANDIGLARSKVFLPFELKCESEFPTARSKLHGPLRSDAARARPHSARNGIWGVLEINHTFTFTHLSRGRAQGPLPRPSLGRLPEPFMRYLAADAARALTREPWHVLADRLPERDDVRVTYSRKVFIPLTRLCQDRCGYCTFAAHGGVADAKRAYLTPDEVLDIARRGVEAGCTEALFTLGDRPEARWPVAREALDAMGFESTVAYLASVAARVLEETGLLPHTNPGVLSVREMARLREVAVSQGLMLETVAEAASAPGGAHAGCVTKLPRTRLRQIELAGRLRVPFTTGLLLGLGETRADTVEALLRVRHSHERWGHVQAGTHQDECEHHGACKCSSRRPPLPTGTHRAAVSSKGGNGHGERGGLPRGGAALGGRLC
jgi:7,8-didemethyl-8-hydroxy-5-deazariboflavin synthase CofG subunit